MFEVLGFEFKVESFGFDSHNKLGCEVPLSGFFFIRSTIQAMSLPCQEGEGATEGCSGKR